LLAEDPRPEPDPKDSIAALMERAKQGDAAAQVSLGRAHANGRGVPKDEAEAVKWYRKAADQGNSYAQVQLGLMCKRGEAVARNYA
jgi:TPR repeat protein